MTIYFKKNVSIRQVDFCIIFPLSDPLSVPPFAHFLLGSDCKIWINESKNPLKRYKCFDTALFIHEYISYNM